MLKLISIWKAVPQKVMPNITKTFKTNEIFLEYLPGTLKCLDKLKTLA